MVGKIFAIGGNEKIILAACGLFLLFVVVGFAIEKIIPQKSRFTTFIVEVVLFFLVAIKFPIVVVIFLACFCIYVLVGTEAEVIKLLKNKKNISPIVTFILETAILLVFFYFSNLVITSTLASYYFYIVSSLFAYLALYAANKYGEGRFLIYRKNSLDTTSLFVGILFLIGFGFVYYMEIFNKPEVPALMLLGMMMFLFFGGSLSIYTYLHTLLSMEK